MRNAQTRLAVLVLVAVAAWVGMTAAAAANDKAGVGLVDPTTGEWWLRDPSGATTHFYYGNPKDYPILGDWNCDGTDTPGQYRQSDGYVYLRNSNSQGNADIKFFFGDPGDIPLAGDFDGDGCDTVSIYRPSEGRFYIINGLGEGDSGLGAAEFSYLFGNKGDQPFVADFDGDGVDTIGLHRASTGLVYYRNSHAQGIADDQFIFGDPNDRLIAGDWTGDGVDTPGVFRPSQGKAYLIHANSSGPADEEFLYGAERMRPVAGEFGPLPGGAEPPPRDYYLIGQFTTYHSCCQNRVHNIHLIADTVDGVVVAPGDSFYVNGFVGARTEAKGYLRDGAIIGGDVYCCDSPINVGGGVSQFATTLYNAVFFAGLEDVVHRPHSIYFSRYPMGREATIVDPVPELAFRNDTNDPVVIDTSYTATSITVRLYGNNERRKVWSGLSGWATTSGGGTVKVTRFIQHANGVITTQAWWHTYKPLPGSSGGGGGGGGGGTAPPPAPEPEPAPGPTPT